MLIKPRHRLLARIHFRKAISRVTPLTWLVWALFVSDLAAPGYLKFNLLVTQFDAVAFIHEALEQ